MIKTLSISLTTILLVTTAALFNSDLYPQHLSSHDILVQDRHPGAQKWFNHCASKYPQALLRQVKFCVGDHCRSDRGVIYFSSHRLERMDQVFKDLTQEQIAKLAKTYPDNTIFEEFAADAYILLHEAAHVLHKDHEKGFVVFAAVVLGFVGFNALVLNKTCENKISAGTGIASAIAGSAAIIATLFAYIRHQERQADTFATEHADPQALIGGMEWFVKVHDHVHGSQKACNSSEISTTLTDVIHDPAHPSPTSRATNILRKICRLLAQDAS